MEKYDILERQYRLLEIYNIDLENENKELKTHNTQLLNESIEIEKDSYIPQLKVNLRYEKEIKRLKETIKILLA